MILARLFGRCRHCRRRLQKLDGLTTCNHCDTPQTRYQTPLIPC